MSDIHDCNGCGDPVYMDNAEHCVVCDSWFCGACDHENGEILWDETNKNYYYVCNDCLGQGLDYINDDNEDDATFTKEEYDRAVMFLKNRNKV